MYKKTQNSHDYLSRTANHSTKGSRRGFAEIGIAPDRKALGERPSEVRRRLSSQLEAAQEERRRMEKELAPRGVNIKNWRTRVTYKYKGAEHLFSDNPERYRLLENYFALGDLVETTMRQLGSISKREKKFTDFFVDAAAEALSEHEFQRVKKSAIDAMKKYEEENDL